MDTAAAAALQAWWAAGPALPMRLLPLRRVFYMMDLRGWRLAPPGQSDGHTVSMQPCMSVFSPGRCWRVVAAPSCKHHIVISAQGRTALKPPGQRSPPHSQGSQAVAGPGWVGPGEDVIWCGHRVHAPRPPTPFFYDSGIQAASSNRRQGFVFLACACRWAQFVGRLAGPEWLIRCGAVGRCD